MSQQDLPERRIDQQRKHNKVVYVTRGTFGTPEAALTEAFVHKVSVKLASTFNLGGDGCHKKGS